MAHILVVDDRPMNREFLVTLLGYYGHTLAEAADGVEALQRVAERKPDLVITDLLMPNMDGEELMHRLREDAATKDMPAIIYTATYRAREARAIADRVGVRQVLAKPCEPKVIAAAVAEALNDASPASELVAANDLAAPKSDIAGLGEHMAQQLGSVQTLNATLAEHLESALQIAAQQATSLTKVRGLETALLSVQSLSLRLTGLVELGLDLARARDADELMDLFCRALQDILSARYAGVVAVSNKGGATPRFTVRGLDEETRAGVANEIADCAAAKKVLGDGAVGRVVIGTSTGDFSGLPASHPPVKNFLACPAGAHGKTIGWLYVANRLGEERFSTDDERLAMALGAQFAIAWDSLALYGELERLVAERTRQLELSNRELEAFSYSVSHDLRAPLRAIDGFTRMVLEKNASSLPAEAQHHLGTVRDQTRKMAALIEDLLELARVGRREMGRHPVKLGDFVRNCLRELQAELQGRDVEWIIGELPVWHGDPILLKQLFLNLLSNALKFTRKCDHARIEIGAERRGAEQVVFVRDNGTGFDMAHAQKLFGVFQRLHGEEEYPGTGIGLAIVRRVAERHGARVWAEGAPGRGATFYIAFPAAA